MIELLSENVEEVNWGTVRGNSLYKDSGVGREACCIRVNEEEQSDGRDSERGPITFISWGCITNYSRCGGLQQQTFILSVLEARCLSKVAGAVPPPKRREYSHASSSFWWLQVFLCL